MNGILSWIFSAITIIGSIYNAYGKVAGFYLWILANICWIIYDIKFKLYSQIPMFIIFTITSIIGIKECRKKKRNNKYHFLNAKH
jgi:hypothetical protein